MTTAGYEFRVIIPESSIEQGISQSLPPLEYVAEAAMQKARAVATSVPDEAIVIAADTVAECDNEILGKPIDRNDARRMLMLMSGQQHFVHTGITIWHRPSDRNVCHVETTVLTMQVLDETTLEHHLESGDWIGKAGAFGFQDGLDWVRIEKGLESNVVGLPVEILPDLIGQVVDGAAP